MKQVVERKLSLLELVLPKSVVSKMRENYSEEEKEIEKKKKKISGNHENEEEEEEEEENINNNRLLYGESVRSALSTVSKKTNAANTQLNDWRELVDDYESATIVFVMIQNFEQLEGQLSSSELIRLFDTIYSDFDQVLSKYSKNVENLYRIKTINHIYMFSSGFPVRHPKNLSRAVEVSLEIIETTRTKRYGTRFGIPPIEVSIGLYHGRVIVGVVGRIPSYDCWSDGVNMASRLATHNKNPMSIQMMHQQYLDEAVGDIKLKFSSLKRKKIEVLKVERIEIKGVENTIECICFCTDAMNDSNNPSSNFHRRIKSRDSTLSSSSSASVISDSSSSNTGIINLLKTLKGGDEEIETFDLQKYGIEYEDDTEFYELEKMSKGVNDRHLYMHIYNEKSGSIKWRNVIRVICCCTCCHFHSLRLNCLFVRTMHRRYVLTNRLIACFFVLAYVGLAFLDILRKSNKYDSFMTVRGGVELEPLDKFDHFEIVIYRGLTCVPIIILATIGLFTPCYKSICCCNAFLNMAYFAVYGVSVLMLVQFTEFTAVRDIFMIQILIYNFGGVHLYVRLLTLFMNQLFLTVYKVIQNSTMTWYMEQQERTWVNGVLDSVPGLFLTIIIAQYCFVDHLDLIFDFYLRAQVHAQRKRIEEEEGYCSNLINSILPEIILKEIDGENNNIDLLHIDRIKSMYIEECSILFADAYHFTQFCQYLSPIDLIESLNNIISKFDKLTLEYECSRVKVIGDCYEVATIPYHPRKSPRKLAKFALKMVRIIKQVKGLEFRIGIHHGAVVAGLIGHERINFDLFGKTIMVAEEYEQKGEKMRIHCSQQFKKCRAHKNNSVQQHLIPLYDAEQFNRDVRKSYQFVEREEEVMIHGELVQSYWLIEREEEDDFGDDNDDDGYVNENVNNSTSEEEEGEGKNIEMVQILEKGIESSSSSDEEVEEGEEFRILDIVDDKET